MTMATLLLARCDRTSLSLQLMHDPLRLFSKVSQGLLWTLTHCPIQCLAVTPTTKEYTPQRVIRRLWTTFWKKLWD